MNTSRFHIRNIVRIRGLGEIISSLGALSIAQADDDRRKLLVNHFNLPTLRG